MNTKTLFFITGALSIVVMYLLGTRLTGRMALDYTQSDGSAAQQTLIPDTSDIPLVPAPPRAPKPTVGAGSFATATPTVVPGATR